jgi:HSP90 family molecular chaperone
VHSSITERIKEFETRIKLLLEENPKEFTTTNSVQQIIVLKGYISELSDLLKQSKKKEEHLSKKNQHYKEKLNSSDALFKEKLNEYKIKIKNYDILINKLYTALEEKFK